MLGRWLFARCAPCLLALVVAGCAMEVGEGPPVQGRAAALRDLGPIEADFLQILNEHRMANGVAPVRAERALNQGARDYSQLMGERNHFDHTGPDGSTFTERMCEAGYEPACGPSTAVGENIASGQSSARDVFRSWRSSPGHNANMLDPAFEVVGIGRAEVPGSEWGIYWTNNFGGQTTDETVPLDDTGGGGGGDAGTDGGGGDGEVGGRKSSGCAAAGHGARGAHGATMILGALLMRRRRRG